MQLNGNTIFITGGSSGIGKGLGEALHRLGNQVIIAGRREDRLKQICEANPGMRYFVLDATDPQAIRAVAARAIAEFPALNWVFNNAGIQRRHDFTPGQPLDDEALVEEVHTNVLGVIRVAGAFVPHLSGQRNATLVNVSSGLAFVPSARFPVYCATKAAVHSFTMSLRWQLRESGVRVMELVPPWVATELGGPPKLTQTTSGRSPMPLDAFVAETLKELETGADEIAIGSAKRLVAVACTDNVKNAFEGMNS